jgi:hypothetical protein
MHQVGNQPRTTRFRALTHLWQNKRASVEHQLLDCAWNVMAHAQKPDFVFRRNGRVHLNRRGRQFSRLLAADVCASAVVMLDTPCSEVVWRVLATTPFASFHFTSPPVRHRVPSHFNWSLHMFRSRRYHCRIIKCNQKHILHNSAEKGEFDRMHWKNEIQKYWIRI